ncbi:Charged multivesicular body protein 3 [Geodia barretti]|nr:Charged multivesicular body protein 3 [Geodia barretti]
MNSVMMTMQQQVSMQRMVGAIGKSTEVMQAMQSLIKVPEISQVMLELSKEMTKAGMIEEILEETFEDLEDDDVEELADKEVEKVLWEVTTGQLGQLSGTPSATPQDDGAVGPEPEAVESDEEEDMTARLEALRS